MALKGRGTINLVLSLDRKFLNDGTYWLNINDNSFPFVGVVEQTNFISPKKYNNENIVYITNYLSSNHHFFKSNKKSLIDTFSPYLKRINPRFSNNWIKKAWVFKSNFAQPIFCLKYSKKIPPFNTPIKNIYLANIQQVYPWDRQTNYAIDLGRKISKLISETS